MKNLQHIKPRLISLQLLSEYVGASKNKVKELIKNDVLPKPCVDEPRHKRWDIRQVDDYIDKLTKNNNLEGWSDIG